MKITKELIEQCDADIKAGHPQNVARRLVKLNCARVERSIRLPLARVCRRAGLYSLGLKVLAYVVLSDEDSNVSAVEMAEYAVLLLRNGALNEALAKLQHVDIQQAPEALLYEAYCHFARWEYEQAIPNLERYLAADLPAYQKQVGRLNLAFALVESRRHEQALHLLEEILKSAADGNRQLRSNCLALRGQVHLQDSRFTKAKEDFDSALSGVGSNDQFFVTKWNLILEGLENLSVEPFRKLKNLAQVNRAWEAGREADLFQLKVQFDNEVLSYLYFGSPITEFRKQVVREVGNAPEQTSYTWGSTGAPCLDLSSGEIDGAKSLNPGRKCHQLLEVLLRDFYRPLQIGGIFSALCPQEQFNISSSSHRMHQLITRTRSWITDAGIPATIVESSGFYSIELSGDFCFRVPRERQSVDIASLQLEHLKSAFGPTQTFTAKEATDKLQLSPATVHRLIHRGLKAGRIKKSGKIHRTSIFQIAEDDAA